MDLGEEEFSLEAYAKSKGEYCHLREITPQEFEYGEDVTDVLTGRHGQVRVIVWNVGQRTWYYCIRRKDIDDATKYFQESRLIRSPAQITIDTKKRVLYAPRKLKHQQPRRMPSFRRRKVNIKDRYSDESWRSRRLDKLT